MNKTKQWFKWDGVIEYKSFIHIRINYKFNPDTTGLSLIRLIKNLIDE